MNIRLIHKNQRGFTLVEMLIAVVIAGFVTGGITMTIIHVFNMDAQTRNDMIAVYQVRQAGKLVSEDMRQARDVDAAEGLGFPLTLTWLDWGSNDTHEVVYTMEPMPSGGFQRLKRSLTVTPLEGGPTTTVSIVAEHIDLAQTYIDPNGPTGSCSFPCGRSFIFTVTATVGGQSKTMTYEVRPRPGS